MALIIDGTTDIITKDKSVITRPLLYNSSKIETDMTGVYYIFEISNIDLYKNDFLFLTLKLSSYDNNETVYIGRNVGLLGILNESNQTTIQFGNGPFEDSQENSYNLNLLYTIYYHYANKVLTIKFSFPYAADGYDKDESVQKLEISNGTTSNEATEEAEEAESYDIYLNNKVKTDEIETGFIKCTSDLEVGGEFSAVKFKIKGSGTAEFNNIESSGSITAESIKSNGSIFGNVTNFEYIGLVSGITCKVTHYEEGGSRYYFQFSNGVILSSISDVVQDACFLLVSNPEGEKMNITSDIGEASVKSGFCFGTLFAKEGESSTEPYLKFSSTYDILVKKWTENNAVISLGPSGCSVYVFRIPLYNNTHTKI